MARRAERRAHERRVLAKRIRQELAQGERYPAAGKPYLLKSTATPWSDCSKGEVLQFKARRADYDYREQLAEAA